MMVLKVADRASSRDKTRESEYKLHKSDLGMAMAGMGGHCLI